MPSTFVNSSEQTSNALGLRPALAAAAYWYFLTLQAVLSISILAMLGLNNVRIVTWLFGKEKAKNANQRQQASEEYKGGEHRVL